MFEDQAKKQVPQKTFVVKTRPLSKGTKSMQMEYSSHACPKLPAPINPSFSLKYTQPIRVGFMRYVQSYPDLNKVNESMLLEGYAKLNKLNYRESHDILTRTIERQSHVGIQLVSKKKQEQMKPKLRYFKLDDSEVREEEVKEVMHYRQMHRPRKGEDVPLDRIFKEKNIDRYVQNPYVT